MKEKSQPNENKMENKTSARTSNINLDIEHQPRIEIPRFMRETRCLADMDCGNWSVNQTSRHSQH